LSSASSRYQQLNRIAADRIILLLLFGGYFFKFFFAFQPGAAFLAICCILELKSVFCMHFGARISHLRAHLAFGFWLLALASLGFTCLHLPSLGLWLMAFGWLWFLLALVLAVHFNWLLDALGDCWILVL